MQLIYHTPTARIQVDNATEACAFLADGVVFGFGEAGCTIAQGEGHVSFPWSHVFQVLLLSDAERWKRVPYDVRANFLRLIGGEQWIDGTFIVDPGKP